MSILSVDNISPIGSGTSVTINNAATLVLTNANIAGVTTTSGGVRVNADGSTSANYISVGVNDDLKIYHHSAGVSQIYNSTGYLELYANAATWIKTTQFNIIDNDATHYHIRTFKDGAVELYHNNTLRLETRTNDVKFHGGLVAVDNVKLQLGSSGDLQLFHDGFHSYVSDPIGIGNLRIRVNTGQVELQPKIGEYGLICKPAGAVELYHNNSRVVKTNTYGLQVGLKAVNDDNNHVATVGWALADDWTKVVFDGSVAGNSPLTIRNQNATYNRYMCYFKFDGGFANYSANDINLCDERVKKDFADVSSQWNNIKNIGFKHFRYKEDSSSEPLKIGVVAQQIETVYPDLIDESWPQDDANPNTGEGTFYKGVKEEQLLMYAVKALQEAQARIETLEAEVAALKGS